MTASSVESRFVVQGGRVEEEDIEASEGGDEIVHIETVIGEVGGPRNYGADLAAA